MSQAVNQTIITTLRASSALVALLDTDPRTGHAAIFKGNKNEAPVDLRRMITFRESTNSPIAKMNSGIDAEMYDFEIWTNDRAASSVQIIFEVMDPLLHLQRLTPLDPTHHQYWETLRIAGGAPDLYDSNLKEWYGLYRYQFLHRRF